MSGDNGRFVGWQVLACYPVDRRKLREIAQESGNKVFVPSVEHVLMSCDHCGCDIWVGPQQRMRVSSPFIRAAKICMDCMADTAARTGLRPVVQTLNPQERHIPRRVR